MYASNFAALFEMDISESSASSSSPGAITSSDCVQLLASLESIDKKLSEVLVKCEAILLMTEDIDESDEETSTKSPEVKKKKLTHTPGQIPYGYARTAPYAYRNSLNHSRSDFGPNPSFGPMRNPYFQ